MKDKYDIFISYRRDSGAQYARILQLMLRQKGYQVFLDYDELTDGIFSDRIKNAIKETPIFILVLSKNAIDRCTNENDWLRQEILLALENDKKIIPVNPDATFNGVSNSVDVKLIPESIKRIANEYQHSDIRFGQALGATIDMMVNNRIEPILGAKDAQSKIDYTVITKEKILENNTKKLTRIFLKLENKRLPEVIDYLSIDGLRIEARQKLDAIRPISIGQASRISGVSPADISVLLIYLEQMRRTRGGKDEQ